MAFTDIVKGFGSKVKKKTAKAKASATTTAQSQITNMERRLKAAKQPVPKKKDNKSWFTELMEALDHPANVVRSGVAEYYQTGSTSKAKKAARTARDKGTYTPGTKVIDAMAKRNTKFGKWAAKTPTRKALAGFAVDVALDPLTYVTVGTKPIAKGAPQVARAIQKELSKETGKKISRKSAERLAKNAMDGNIPTGKMGVAVERALGKHAETKRVPTGYKKISATERKLELGKQATSKRESAAKLAKKAEVLKGGDLPKSGALPPGKITDAELRAQIARKEAQTRQLRERSGKLKKGELPKAGALPGRVRTDYIAGYKTMARSEPRTVEWAGRQMDARDLLKYQKNLEKQANKAMRGITQAVRQAYNGAKESDIYRRIRERGGITPSPSGMFAGEYRDTIPIALRNRNGLPIDQMADELGMSVRELLDALRGRKRITADDIQREAQQVARSDPEYRRLLEEMVKVDDHIYNLNQQGRKITSGVEPFVGQVKHGKPPKVTNTEARKRGREMARPLDAQAKQMSAEAQRMTRQMTPGEVTNVDARRAGRQLAKPLDAESARSAKAARALEREAGQIRPEKSKGFASVTDAAGRAGEDVTAVRFMGVDVWDVTPIAKPIRTAAGAIIESSPALTKVRDKLGRAFIFNYTPKSIKGVERASVTGAKERITQTMREIPYSRNRAMREVAEQWGKTGKKAAEEAPYIIEKTGFGSVAGNEAAVKAVKLFDDDVQRMADAGLPLNVLDDYVMHIYKDPPERVQQILANWRGKPKVAGAQPSFTKRRSIPTLEEAEALGLHPEKDVRKLTMVHRALTDQAAVINRTGQDLIRMGDNIVRDVNPGGWVNVTHTAIPSLEGKFVHPEVARALENIAPTIQNTDEGIRAVTDSLDALTRAWKAVVLFRPAFHMRNAIGNVFLNIADGVFNPGRYPQAMAAYSGVLKNINLNGKNVPTDVVLDWFEREALKGQGMFKESLHGTTRAVTKEADMMLNVLHSRGYNVRYYAVHPFEASRQFGEATDSVGRLANFLHHLDNGLSPAEAAKRTRAALFDYGALTPFEQTLRKSIVPFYSWTRFALPKMVEKLVGAPGLFTGSTHLRQSMVNLHELDEQNLPEYLDEMQAIPLWVDAQGNVHYMTWNLPLTELTRLKPDVREMTREAVNMLNPLITAPMELVANKQMFNDMPITEYDAVGGKPMWQDYGKWALGQLGMPAEIVKYQREREQQQKYRDAVAAGEEPEVEPTQKQPWERLLQMTSVQNPASWERQSLYQRKDQLQQAIKAAEQEGVKVPTTEEIGKPGEKKGFQKAAEGDYGTGFQGAAAQDVAKYSGSVPDAVKQAMQIAGVDASWGPYMNLLMQKESGGNPLARNSLWVNYNTGQTASGGRPGPNWYQAIGLYQMMEPTFRSYAAPGHADIYNPLDNTIASINYIKSRYGHPANIPRLGQSGYRGY